MFTFAGLAFYCVVCIFVNWWTDVYFEFGVETYAVVG